MTRLDGRDIGKRLRFPSFAMDLLVPMAKAEGITPTQKLVNLTRDAHAAFTQSAENGGGTAS